MSNSTQGSWVRCFLARKVGNTWHLLWECQNMALEGQSKAVQESLLAGRLGQCFAMLEKTVNQCGKGYYPFPAIGPFSTQGQPHGPGSIQWQTIWSQWCSGSAWVSWIDLWGLLFAAGMKLTQMAANGNISALTKINKNSWQMECASSAKRMQ